MQHVKSFVAGFASTLVCHQGVLALLHLANPASPAPFNLAGTAPFGVPAVISLAFWCGVWGIVLWRLIRSSAGARHWTLAVPAAFIIASQRPFQDLDLRPFGAGAVYIPG